MKQRFKKVGAALLALILILPAVLGSASNTRRSNTLGLSPQMLGDSVLGASDGESEKDKSPNMPPISPTLGLSGNALDEYGVKAPHRDILQGEENFDLTLGIEYNDDCRLRVEDDGGFDEDLPGTYRVGYQLQHAGEDIACFYRDITVTEYTGVDLSTHFTPPSLEASKGLARTRQARGLSLEEIIKESTPEPEEIIAVYDGEQEDVSQYLEMIDDGGLDMTLPGEYTVEMALVIDQEPVVEIQRTIDIQEPMIRPMAAGDLVITGPSEVRISAGSASNIAFELKNNSKDKIILPLNSDILRTYIDTGWTATITTAEEEIIIPPNDAVEVLVLAEVPAGTAVGSSATLTLRHLSDDDKHTECNVKIIVSELKEKTMDVEIQISERFRPVGATEYWYPP